MYKHFGNIRENLPAKYFYLLILLNDEIYTDTDDKNTPNVI